MLVATYQSVLRNIQEEQRSLLHCSKSLKSCTLAELVPCKVPVILCDFVVYFFHVHLDFPETAQIVLPEQFLGHL
jgi:hypothetical protein